MSTQHIVYKKVGDLEISLTIILPKNATNVPVLLYLHGEGGLLQGTRSVFAPHLLRSVEKYQHALVTADYRLVPQVGIEDIDEDVMDCIDFIRGSEVSYAARHNPLFFSLTIITGTRQAAGKPWRHRHHTPRCLR
jgi:acetyl esterase/lipase